MDVSSTKEPTLRRSIFSALIVTGVVLAACYGSTFMLAQHLLYRELDPTLAGSAISTGIIATLISAVFAGRIAEHLGLFRCMSAASASMALAMFGFSAVPIIPFAIFFGGVFLGIAWSVFYILAPLILIDAVGNSVRVKYLTFLSGSQMLGLGLSEPVGSLLVDIGFVYSDIYLGLGALAFVCSIYFLKSSDQYLTMSKVSHSLTLSSAKKVLVNYTVLPAAMIGLLACIFSGLATFQALYAEPRGFNPSTFFVVFTVSTVVLRFGLATQITKLPIYGLAISLILVTIISLFIFYHNNGSFLFYVISSLLFATGYGLSYSTLNAITVNIAESEGLPISSTSQIFTLFYFTGIFGFPFVAGKLITTASVIDMLSIMIWICILAAGLGIILRKSHSI